jgi:hypothetical protein
MTAQAEIDSAPRTSVLDTAKVNIMIDSLGDVLAALTVSAARA